MKLERFKEKDKKKIGIILFTITCVLLISGVILYRTFAIFETNNNLDLIKGNIQDTGDIEFAFYINGNISKNAPKKEEGYSLDTSSSYCKDVLNDTKISNVNWDEENWEVRIKGVSTTKTKCYLYFKEIYKESILNGAIPDLGNGRLIPVTIVSNEKPTGVTYNGGSVGGRVYKADITDQNTPWYSYQNKQWANAVILKDGETDHYQPDEEIPEDKIESYFVWIPRYRYKLKENESTYNSYTAVNSKGQINDNNSLTNTGATSVYEIEFETKDKGLSTGSTQGQWLTHPAFTSFNSNGMWVGKFETGYNGAVDTAGAQINSQASDKIIIKPNTFSWRSIQVGNAFYASYNYLRELESHMMKNSEWGAIFYLTQSKYGLCTNGNCTEPRINNNGKYITGYSANFDPTCGYTATNETCNKYEETNGKTVKLNEDGDNGYSYYNPSSQIASTTNNYYGIYDMAGGAWEYVMGVMQSSSTNVNPASGRSSTYNSGFKGVYSCVKCDNTTEIENLNGLEWPSSKYYDLYDYSTSNQYFQRGKLGDATKELGPFYSVIYTPGGKNQTRYVNSYFADYSYFVNSGDPWFMRGGAFYDGSGTGVGTSHIARGRASGDYSFRIVLIP